MKKYTSVEDFINGFPQWETALRKLHDIVLQQDELEETIKWGAPTYTFKGKNIVGLGAFKSYVGLWFFQGVFLKDASQVLMNAQEGKTKAMRQWRFNSEEDIVPDLVSNYIQEAIQNQRDGKEVKPVRKSKTLEVPKELQEVLTSNNDLEAAFSKLSLSKRREYAEYIDTAKREATKQSRLAKIIPMILEGAGLNDKYR
ncbi:DUF1801 domain-containing protein [uncultured Kordia sp.]|uniref:YdeI/OmpD-associated family protein n=1 Tax=uncultured Kordia sp. TaxID=507699 RepID=UPI002633BE13|nr:DUF1801 domain-containing protein [uncultured Kordia sp.]